MDSGVGIAYGTSRTVVLEMGTPVARAKLKNLNFELDISAPAFSYFNFLTLHLNP